MTTPSYPAPPPNAYAPATPLPTAPSTVKTAFLVYVVVAVLAIVGIVLVVTSDVWNAAIAAAGDGLDANGVSASSLANTVKITVIVIGIIFVALYLLFAFKMRAGRNWARIVLTVLSALSIVNTARASASISVNGTVYSVGSTQISGWIGAALAVIAIVLMYMGPSNIYFKASKAARAR